MKRVGFFVILVFIWIMCYSGCKDISFENEDCMTYKISKSEAIALAWDALKNTESEEVGHKYHIDNIRCSEGYWHILFIGDPGVLGDDFLVIVAEDKTVKVLPGE